MNFIIFDLEWNNAYNYKLKRGMNEIIEIGAVKLDENLDVVDTFKQLIKPQLSRKLGSRFKNLTHITIDEINDNGIPFEKAFDDFAKWCGRGDKLFLSWSTSDLYTLVANFKYFENTVYVDFMTKYADAQKYCMSFIENASAANQISLSHCAETFGIDTDSANFHRALEDCMITALCFKKVYDHDKLAKYIHTCDISFFERLVFKPYYIKETEYEDFKLNDVKIICPICGGTVAPIKKYEFTNNTFRGAGLCEKCSRKFWTYVRAKQTYDEVVVSSRAVPINKKRAKHIN